MADLLHLKFQIMTPLAKCNAPGSFNRIIVVVVLLFYVHGKHLRSCRDGQLT